MGYYYYSMTGEVKVSQGSYGRLPGTCEQHSSMTMTMTREIELGIFSDEHGFDLTFSIQGRRSIYNRRPSILLLVPLPTVPVPVSVLYLCTSSLPALFTSGGPFGLT